MAILNTEGYTTQNYGATEDMGLRLTGLWTPSANFKWRLSLDGYQSHGAPGGSVETGENGLRSTDSPPINSRPIPIQTRTTTFRMEPSGRGMDIKLTDNLSIAYIAGHQRLKWSYLYGTLGQPGAPRHSSGHRGGRYSFLQLRDA